MAGKSGVGWVTVSRTHPNCCQFSEWTKSIWIVQISKESYNYAAWIRLHVFVDSSSRAFGAVAYSYNRESNNSNILASKQRVTPSGKQKLIIPKVELTASLVGARLAHHRMKLFTFSFIHLWTDNYVVLSWLNHLDSIKDVYASNRTVELRYLIDVCDMHMHHIPTKHNPSDILPRGCKVKQLIKHDL